MTYFYSIVRYEPNLAAGERINVGAIVGNDEEGFVATWSLTKAQRGFNDTFKEKQITDVISGLNPLSVGKLIVLSESLIPFVVFSTPRHSNIPDRAAALDTLSKVYLV